MTGKQSGTIVGLLAVLVVIGITVPILNKQNQSHAASDTILSLSPTSQSVASGSNLTVSVLINPGTASINTVQSVLTYNPSNFSVVSVTSGSAFNTSTPLVETAGSIGFAVTNTSTPVTTAQTVETIVLKAIGVGTSNVSLAGVCPANSFVSTCSAAYDSVNDNNDLGSVANASYTVTAVVPSTPTGLTTTSVTGTSVGLSWNASTDNGGPGVAGYYIYSSGVKIGSTTTNSYPVTGLVAGTAYSFTVAAYDSATTPEVSQQSTALNVTAAVPPPSTPSNPVVVSNSSVFCTFNSIPISWTPSTDNGGPGIAGYYIFRDGVKVGSSATNSWTDNTTGLQPGTSYTYTVEAYDKNGTPLVSGPSTALNTKTNKLADIDGDGTVTAHDLSILISHYNSNYAPAEFDLTNLVEAHDLSILIGNYGS